MDTGYTYGDPEGARCALYIAPDLTPPDHITVTRDDGRAVIYTRISDLELDCGETAGVGGACRSFECHRARLGYCQCGRHRSLSDSPNDTRPPIRLRRMSTPVDPPRRTKESPR